MKTLLLSNDLTPMILRVPFFVKKRGGGRWVIGRSRCIPSQMHLGRSFRLYTKRFMFVVEVFHLISSHPKVDSLLIIHRVGKIICIAVYGSTVESSDHQ